MPMSRTPTKGGQQMDKSSEESKGFKGFEDDSTVSDSKAMEKLVPLFRQRNQVMQKVSRMHDAVENEEAPVTLAQLKVFSKKLQSAYDEFSGFHSQIIAAVPENEMNGQEEEYILFEELFDETSAIVESLLIRMEKPQVPLSSSPQVIVHQQPLKAPIPTFDGDYAKWPKFKAMFQDVMAQSRDSDAIKLYHLDKALIDKAAGVLDAKTINEANYEHAWRILTERYENKRIIVEMHIRGLLTLPKMETESHTELRHLLDKCNNHVESLEYLKQELIGVSELMVIYLLTSALDKATRKHWEQTMKPGELPNYNLTISFLKSQCQVLERCENAHYPSYPKKTITTTKGVSHRSYAATSIQEPPTDKCDFCSEQHRNFQCNKLNAMSASEKIEKVRSAGVCFNCLRKGHRSKECPSPRSCRKCQRRHHTQLHEDEVTSNVNYNSKSETCTSKITLVDEDLTTKQSNETNVLSTCSCNHARTTKTVLLLTAVVLVMDKDKQPHQCRVLLDSGSQVNFLTERMANILGIPKQRASVQIAGINNLRTIARDKVEVDFQSRCSEYRARLECLVTPEITGKIPSVLINVEEWNIPTNIMLADPNFFKPEQIDMLIGMELFFNLLKPDHITNDENIPDLRDSHLGWLVTGTVSSNVNTLYSQVASVESIEESMQKFWQVEELADTTTFSSEEQRCEEHFVSTHSRDVSGRFVVRLPLKENAAELESCRALALKRFFMLESRFLRNPELKMQYVDFIREYRLLNHCRQVDESKDNPLLKSYYMPHHAVLRPDSSSTKYTEDDEVLTPNHFLLGCAGEAVITIDDVSKAEATRQHWKRAQSIVKGYWNRWIKEYLPTLTKRNKWLEKTKPIKVGDIVVFADEEKKGKWHKGKVIRTTTNMDGQVRSATVETIKGEITRPAVKLAVLDVSKNNEIESSKDTTISSPPLNFVGVIKSAPGSKEEIKGPRNPQEWGVRKTVNIEHVKELASKLKPKPQTKKKVIGKIRPYTGTIQKAIVTAMAILVLMEI
ncbi:uncharacterized protein LOC129765881 [Toxorhynchites rutilus septentrionalis]|uniref:uncharacterized protein LOC129765881 n=1 Tax=Toxorhynchites rutilus septentrionalis TaxID=329112 RepID=UPI002478E9EE|nr:uncharacterized protein LOC129765881 [Toxorhynchites rutilus septentrionalis]